MKKFTLFLSIFCLFATGLYSQRVMENLNRGLVAVQLSSSQVFLSWRFLGSDPDSISFNLYRNGVKINQSPLAGATNFTDQSATGATSYDVKAILNGNETGESYTASVWGSNYLDIPMNVPAGMTMPDGSTCYYIPADCSAGDVDGDGDYEIVVKWDPSNAHDNSQSGYTGNVYLDVYEMSGQQLCRIDLGKNIRAGAHYTQFQVADYDGDGKAEIACKTAPGTKDGTGNYISKGPAAIAVHTVDYRNSGGYILTGPEYFTVFSGATGAELATANYNPARGTVSSWGDNYGNRVDRFLAGTAWLDGVLPSVIMCRGYYTRSVIAAWNYRNGTLTNVWTYDSGSSSGNNLYGQGNHNMSIGDVDNDGKDEIIWGAGAVDHDGKFMYKTGLGHGDAMHLSDHDPDRKGLEVWSVHESTGAAYGEELHDARTGAVIWGTKTGSDNGRGVAANIIAGNRGAEMWSASGPGLMSKSGQILNTSKTSMNFRIYWDGDLESELLDNIYINKYGAGNLLTATGCASNNSTKATPGLSADILGDWREEVIFRTSDNKKLRIFTTTIPTSNRIYTLMHDPLYRAAIAWQNTAYNQPPHTGFYMGDDMDTPPASAVYAGEKRWSGASNWDLQLTQGWKDSENQVVVYHQGDGVLFDVTAGINANVSLTQDVNPQSLKFNTPFQVVISGTGSITGNTELRKLGTGVVKLNNNNSFTGNTTIWDGEFYNNGILSASEIFVQPFTKAGGNGVYGKQFNLKQSILEIGASDQTTGKLFLMKSLKEIGKVSYNFDFISSNGQISAHDTLLIGEDWIMDGKSEFNLRVQNGILIVGEYLLVECKGKIEGDLTKIKINGVPSYLSYVLLNNNGKIILKLSPPAILTWTGSVNSTWDNGKSNNWLLLGESKPFSANDSVMFNDESAVKSIQIPESVFPSVTKVQTEGLYTFTGTGSIEGVGSLVKSGTGKLILSNTNKYTGKTIINEGTLELATMSNGGIASPMGAATKASANIVIDGGKLQYTGSTATTDRGITFGPKGGVVSISNLTSTLTYTGQLTGVGKFIKDGTGKISLSTANNLTGGTDIKAGSIVLSTDVANVSGLGSQDTISLMGGSIVMFDSPTTDNTSNWNLKIPLGNTGTLNTDSRSNINGTITGRGVLNYYSSGLLNTFGSDASLFEGTINVTSDADGGYFMVNNNKGFENAKLNLSNNVTMMYKTTANLTIPIGELSGTAKSILGAGGTGLCNINWEIGARNIKSTFNGIISNAQISGTGAFSSITKVGSSVLILTNANTYTGGTFVNSGELMVNNTTGSGTGSGDVHVLENARLSGSGIIGGHVVVEVGGELAPGNGIGTLTVNKNVKIPMDAFLQVDIDKTAAKNDLLQVSGSLELNGTLLLNPTEETVFADGDVFKIIGGNITGVPQGLIPTIPGEGLEWDLSELISAGTIKVRKLTGLTDNHLNTELYPNPVIDKLHIKSTNISGVKEINIFNLLGNLITSTVDISSEELLVDFSSFDSGIYMIQMKTEDATLVRKIIKK